MWTPASCGSEGKIVAVRIIAGQNAASGCLLLLQTLLKAAGAAHHRSLEDGGRTLVHIGLARGKPDPKSEDLVVLATCLFGPERGVDFELPPRDPALDRPPPHFAT